MGGNQNDAIQNIRGGGIRVIRPTYNGDPTGAFAGGSGNRLNGVHPDGLTFITDVDFDASRAARTSTETRPVSTTLVPRLHV